MTDPHLERAWLLLDQERHELAEKEVRQSLASDPDNSNAHALLALCQLQGDSYEAATHEAQQAIQLAPDEGFPYYVLATVLAARNQFPEAETAIQEAISIDAVRPAYFGKLAEIRFARGQWQPALAAAEQGLQFDPEHVGCTNLRAMCLVKLGRKSEAGDAVRRALERQPEDAMTHANLGWTLVEQGDHQQALGHFQEALRIDPTFDWARQGIVEALKAKHLIYRLLLGYFLWMMKLSGRAQWGVLIGGYLAFRILGRLARSNPELAIWIAPLLILYAAFAIMTWIANPLFNLLLRLDRYGRMALSREQIVTSNWVGCCLLGILFSLALMFVIGVGGGMMAAFTCALAIPPLSAIYRCHRGWPRTTMILITVGLAAVGLSNVGIVTAFTFMGEAIPGWLAGLERPLFSLFIFAAIGSQFAANALAAVVPRK